MKNYWKQALCIILILFIFAGCDSNAPPIAKTEIYGTWQFYDSISYSWGEKWTGKGSVLDALLGHGRKYEAATITYTDLSSGVTYSIMELGWREIQDPWSEDVFFVCFGSTEVYNQWGWPSGAPMIDFGSSPQMVSEEFYNRLLEAAYPINH